MRFFQTLTALLLPIAALAAKKPTGDRFKEYFGKQQSTAPIKFDDDLYKQLTSAPRDYSIAILLTALEARFGCQLCRDFHPEWEILAKSWTKGDKKGESRLLFGTLDFADGKGTFQSMMLQTAPVLLLFQPTTGPNAKADAQPTRYDFNTGSGDANVIHSWIARHLPDSPHPPLRRPINYTRIIVGTTSVLGFLTFASVAWPYVMPVATNRNLWAALSLLAVLIFTSGHMYNHIRKVPYVTGDGKGGLVYFAGGFQNQFGMETQIIAVMYGVLAFATISLALKVPRMTNPKTQAVAVAVWGGVMFGMYSFLLSVFRIKNGGYPFYLPPF